MLGVMSPGGEWRWILVCVLAAYGVNTQASVEYGGFLGCAFDSSVCQPDEACINDGLFGNCQGPGTGPLDDFQYEVDYETLAVLEAEIERLLEEGYNWHDIYTQCVTGTILLSYRSGEEYDPELCGPGSSESALAPEDPELEPETQELLDNYFQEYYTPSESVNPADYDYEYNDLAPAVNKKDQLVEIHKYLKEKAKRVKSVQPVYDVIPSDYDDVMQPDYDDVIPDEVVPEDELDESLDELLAEMSPTDLEKLKYYLENPSVETPEVMDDNNNNDYADLLAPEDLSPADLAPEYEGPEYEGPEYDEYRGPMDSAELGPIEAEEPTPEYIDYDTAGYPDEPQSDFNYNAPPSDYNAPPSDYNAPLVPAEVLDQPIPEEKPVSGLSEQDAELLEALISEQISVEQLSDAQIQRLLEYVDDMIDYARTDIQTAEPLEQQIRVLEDKEVKRNPLPKAVVNEEQMGTSVFNNPAGNAKIRVVSVPHIDTKRVSLEGALAPEIDTHDHGFDSNNSNNDHTTGPKYEAVNGNFAYVVVQPALDDVTRASAFVDELSKTLHLAPQALLFDTVDKGDITFYMNPSLTGSNATTIAKLTMSATVRDSMLNATGLAIVNAGIGRDTRVSVKSVLNNSRYFIVTFVLCGVIAGIVLGVIALYIIRHHKSGKQKVAQLSAAEAGGDAASKDYQDLCRQRMQIKSDSKDSATGPSISRVSSVSTSEKGAPASPGKNESGRSSTSSWSEEPVQTNMDISTGHIVLSYMEDHLENKERLNEEWDGLCGYEAEPNSICVSLDATNMRKNRYTDILPYDHSRVVLSNEANVAGSDYINANTITDHDPRNPAYIATQGPLPHTVADFWQMVWEQGSVVIVSLSKLSEGGTAMCHRYWPEEGSDLYHIYEIHLVSEHIWCDDYLVRSFYLKNLQTNETRTVTQFHYLTWPDLGIPNSSKTLLDFRRKVNKSYRGRSCPIVVHCSDGSGRTGTYCTIDMVLNRLSKGAKEIDIAATLEHIRDQRMSMVKTKEQFEFALASVAEEVHAVLKALPQ